MYIHKRQVEAESSKLFLASIGAQLSIFRLPS